VSPTKQAQTAATTTALIQLARQLFVENGYAGVALEDLAARAGMTRGAIYHHFGSKQGLFEAVLTAAHAETAAAIESAAMQHSDPWEQLVAGCHAFIAAASAPSVRRILLIDGPAVLGWRRWRELDAEHSEPLLEDVLAELADAGLVDRQSTAAAGVMLSGAMNEAALWLARPETTKTDIESVHATLDRLLEALRLR
jgi:AcrR family transcriptional regulator